MSKNKKITSGVYNLNFDKQIENAPIVKNSQRGWVNYGKKNLYPFDLLNLYSSSVTHRACVDFAVNSIVGNGVDYEQMEGIIMPNYAETWDSFVRKIALDYILYGSFAFQIIKNRDGKTYSIYHQPFETVRLSPYDEDGQISSAWICSDWSALGKYQPIELPIFGFQEGYSIKMGQPYLFVYRTYSPQNNYYAAPIYSSALNAIQAEIEHQKFDLKSILNNFVPSGMLEMGPVESDKDKQDIINNINKMFIGSEGVNSLMITFASGNGESPVKFTPFVGNSTNVNLYGEANERTINRILEAHRIPSKALIGLPMDASGFSNQGEMLEAAYNLYNINVGNNNRETIIGTINKFFAMNGVDIKLVLKPLKYNILGKNNEEEIITNETETDAKVVDDNNLEEKVNSKEINE